MDLVIIDDVSTQITLDCESDFSVEDDTPPPGLKKGAKKPAAKVKAKATGKRSTKASVSVVEPAAAAAAAGPTKKTATKRKDKDIETSVTNGTGTTIEETYKKVQHRDHVLLRPDTYVGKSKLDETEGEVYIYDRESKTIVKRPIQYVPALFKIFDEGLVNMRDHAERMRVKAAKQLLLKSGEAINDPTITLNDIYRQVKHIGVKIDSEMGTIMMENDGNGIDIVKHIEEQIYIPEMIFFHLLTGTNFNDTEERTWGGRNGYGSKLISIYSTEATIETVDAIRKLKYIQTCRNNMSVIDPPVITKCTAAPYTRLTFKPDLKRFDINSLDSYDHMALLHRRAIDIAGCTDKMLNVTFNDEKVAVRDFEHYVDLYFGSKKEFKRVKLQPNDRWEVYVGLNPNERFDHVSFVNGISTSRGGKHVDHVSTIITNRLVDAITDSKNQKLKGLKPAMVKNLLIIFINATIINPDFDNQMKDCLLTPSKSFGSHFEMTADDTKSLIKLGLVESCIKALLERDQKKLGGMGSKGKRIRDLKSVVAKYAGGTRSSKCTLILTEGDSAKTIAISGLAALQQEERYYIGIMPLAGKIINVKKELLGKIIINKEFKRIIDMMGLRPGMTDFSKLNYGHIAVMTDADHDGYHIKALLFNMFHRFWPGLLKQKRFFLSIRTPIVGITRKTKKLDKQYVYSYVEFIDWQTSHRQQLGEFEYVFYKGLGTHTPEEAREIFSNLQYIDYVWENNLTYQWLNIVENQEGGGGASASAAASAAASETPVVRRGRGVKAKAKTKLTAKDLDDYVIDDDDDAAAAAAAEDETPTTSSTDTMSKRKPVETVYQGAADYCDASFKLAFDVKMADHRKDWLYKYLDRKADQKVDYRFQADDSINYFDFINSELVEFSVADCERSIPNIIDGLKPSQRKIMYTCLKRNLTKKIKVEQLGGSVSAKTNYHHGATSLYEAIILLAQDYVGSNNINMLMPVGQFGTRVENGDDHASPRYIFTHLNPITDAIFDKRDLPLLDYIYDEGKKWEPRYYTPIIPLILVNGTIGIGTGWSTTVPCFNIEQILDNIRRYLAGEKLEKMVPYYRGFKGTIEQIGTYRFKSTGCYDINTTDGTVTITELPVGPKGAMSYQKYNNFLESLLDKMPKTIRDVECHYTDVTILAIVQFQDMKLSCIDRNEIEKMLKLSFNISTSNMNLYTSEGKLKHYDTPEEIITDFLDHRMHVYNVRKQYLINKYKQEREMLIEMARFISYEIDDGNDFTIRKLKVVQALELLRRHKFKTTDEIEKLHNTNFTISQNSDELNAITIAAENDDDISSVVDDSDDDGGGDKPKKKDRYEGYGYLVKMHMINQTVEMIEKLNNERHQKEIEIETLNNITVKELYDCDLDRVTIAYEKFEKAWSEKAYKQIYDDTKTKRTKKAATKRATTRKVK